MPTATFSNPIVANGADPWVIMHNGRYYYCQSCSNNSITVAVAERLEDLSSAEACLVWTAVEGTLYAWDVWAPELHFLRGRWFIYFAADDGNNDNHRMYVLESVTDDPQGAYCFKGQLAAPTDRWAIDGTVLELADGRLYFIWSGWEGFVNEQQNLYIAPMSDPCTISGERVCISVPEYPWELNGGCPLINEGPEVLMHGEKLHLIYSASGSWCDDYCLGQLTFTGGDPLNRDAWVKKPTAVFARTDNVFGPGHASFTKSPDGTEDLIVYHSAKFSGAGWDRQVNMQRFTWDVEGNPVFGEPVAPGVEMAVPSSIHRQARL